MTTQPDALAVTEVTLGEVYRTLVAQGKTLGDISASLEKRPTWEDINRLEEARDKEQKAQDAAIKDLEDGSRWLVRTVGAALVTSLGAAAVVALRLGGG